LKWKRTEFLADGTIGTVEKAVELSAVIQRKAEKLAERAGQRLDEYLAAALSAKVESEYGLLDEAEEDSA
jgi:hypothetical protein